MKGHNIKTRIRDGYNMRNKLKQKSRFILSNNKGSGISFIISGTVIILFMIIFISGTLHNNVLLSRQTMIRHAMEVATRSAMRCIDMLDIENLERISRGEFPTEYNYISLDMVRAYNKFIDVLSLALAEDKNVLKNKTILISIEPKGASNYTIKTIYKNQPPSSINKTITSSVQLENIINQEVSRIVQNSESDEYTSRVDINVLLKGSYFYGDAVLEKPRDTLLVSVLYDYEIDGIFPIIDKKEGITTKHKYYTALYGAVSHIRKAVEEK